MKKVLIVLGFGLLAIGAMGLFAYVTMSLWNWLLPVIFGLPLITFWQAIGLLILRKIIFGGFGRGGRSHGGKRWKHRMKRRWMSMSPEQRDSYKTSYAHHCYDENTVKQNPEASE